MATVATTRPLFFAGKPVLTDQLMQVANPATDEIIAEVADAGPAEVTAAVEHAAEAFGRWRETTAAERGRLLVDAAGELAASADEIARTITLENGKPVAEARTEVDFAIGYLRWFAEEGRRAAGEVIPSPDPRRRWFTTLEPIGVVGAITPWNFPAAMVARKLAPALAAGCTVVLKPAPETPLTALLIAEGLGRAGLPSGVLSVVPSTRAREVADVFYRHPGVRKLSFTGSTEVGREILRGGADGIKPAGLELGGNAPAIVFQDADLDLAVREVIGVKLLRAGGQSCICANRIYVHEAIYDEFRDRFLAAAADVRVGDGFAPDAQVGPLINATAVRRVAGLVAQAKSGGALVHTGEAPDGPGNWQPVTVIEGAREDMAIAGEELFAPIAPLYRFVDVDEVVERANATPQGLAAYVFTRSLSRALRVGEALEAGFVGVNDARGYVHEVPFGGVKHSGIGREGGAQGLCEYLHIKTWAIGLDDHEGS